MIYRVWAAWQKHRITDWRALCTHRGETPVGKGALDEAFSLAAEAERATAKSEPFAAVFLDCSKCYERVDLVKLERAAEAARFPLEALSPSTGYVPWTKTDPCQWSFVRGGRSYLWNPCRLRPGSGSSACLPSAPAECQQPEGCCAEVCG
eukprot:3770642-Amphidinium_carterae.2